MHIFTCRDMNRVKTKLDRKMCLHCMNGPAKIFGPRTQKTSTNTSTKFQPWPVHTMHAHFHVSRHESSEDEAGPQNVLALYERASKNIWPTYSEDFNKHLHKVSALARSYNACTFSRVAT